MNDQAEQTKKRQRTLIIMQIVRFVVATIMLGLSVYLQDLFLGLLAAAFLILGSFTTWIRLRDSDQNS
jgi:hypothetical protein